jgi:hypothetical protein
MKARNAVATIGLTLAAAWVPAGAMAQSDGRPFDAFVVLTPGMRLERGQALFTGGYQSGMLQHGDLIHTDPMGFSGAYRILTSDGSVIGIGGNATVAIDGRQIGFDVFRVLRGSARILGNVNAGYPMPLEFRSLTPFRTGNVIVFPNPNPFLDRGQPNPFLPPFPRPDERLFFPINGLTSFWMR